MFYSCNSDPMKSLTSCSNDENFFALHYGKPAAERKFLAVSCFQLKRFFIQLHTPIDNIHEDEEIPNVWPRKKPGGEGKSNCTSLLHFLFVRRILNNDRHFSASLCFPSFLSLFPPFVELPKICGIFLWKSSVKLNLGFCFVQLRNLRFT
jgi:hypothetical protein